MDSIDEIVGFEEPEDEVDRLAYEVIGAAIEVHRNLGPGYLESVYQAAMCLELDLRGVPFLKEVPFAVEYKGRKVSDSRLDLVVGNLLIVELKACESLAAIHTAQLISYLKMSRYKLGILINFNVRRLKEGVKRVVLT